jgi:hypothetical protein
VYRYTSSDTGADSLVWFDRDDLAELHLDKTFFTWSLGGLNVALEEETEGRKYVLEGLSLRMLFPEDLWLEVQAQPVVQEDFEMQESKGEQDSDEIYSDGEEDSDGDSDGKGE